jgi:hypothetical protein
MTPARLLQGLDARRLAVFVLLVLPVVGSFRHPLVDTDLWWHLKTGEWIVAHRAVPWEDPFSYTASGHLWIAYSWLAEIVFYTLVKTFGFFALLDFKAAVVTTMVGLLYLACRSAGARPPVAVATTALAALPSSVGWGERPQMFTLLFVALFSWALRAPQMRSRLPWLAPVVTALWANLHILFVAGIALLGLAAVCAALERRPVGPLVVATTLSALAALVNPYGYRLIAHLPTMIVQPHVIRAVSEFQSPDFASPLGLLFVTFLCVSIVSLSFSPQRMTLFELVTFLGPLAMGLYMVRNVSLFAILAAPTVARHAEAALPPGREPPQAPPPLRLAVMHGLVVVCAIALVAGLVPRGRTWRETIPPATFPVAAADFVASNYNGARLFNDFNWGGFLIYRLFPGARVSIDGRTQVYGKELLHAYVRSQYLLAGWDRFLEDCHPDLVLWPANGPLANVLRRLPQWRIAFEDDVAVVFEPSDRTARTGR